MANLVSEQELFFTAFEPKASNRFVLYIDGIPSYTIKKVSRPSFTQEAKPLDHINMVRNVMGKRRWGPIQMTLYDPIAPSGAQAVIEWARLHHEPVTGRNGYLEFYKKDLTLNVLGPVGDKVEEWIIKGAQITEANFGELDWANDNPIEFTLTVQPDYCILNY
jgi:hypothetical protein